MARKKNNVNFVGTDDLGKVHQRFPLSDIKKVGLSPFADDCMVIHAPQFSQPKPQPGFDTLYRMQHKSEFVFKLTGEFKAQTRVELPLEFNRTIKFAIKGGSERSVTFVESKAPETQVTPDPQNKSKAILVQVGNFPIASEEYVKALLSGKQFKYKPPRRPKPDYRRMAVEKPKRRKGGATSAPAAASNKPYRGQTVALESKSNAPSGRNAGAKPLPPSRPSAKSDARRVPK